MCCCITIIMQKSHPANLIEFKNVSPYFSIISVCIVLIFLIFGLLVPLYIYPKYFLDNFLYFFPYPLIVVFFVAYRFTVYRKMATIEVHNDTIIIVRQNGRTTVPIKNIKTIEMGKEPYKRHTIITTKNDLKIGVFNRKIRRGRKDLFNLLSSKLRESQ